MAEENKKCKDCGVSEICEELNNEYCITCLQYRLNKVNRTELNMHVNWDDKYIQKQWKNTSEQSMQKILSKCSCTNYHN